MAETNQEQEQTKNQQKTLASDTDDNNLVFDHFFGTAEKTDLLSSYVEDTLYAPYNPDDLYQKCGDHSIYEEMGHDDQVSVCLQLKKDLIVGSGWDIIADDETQAELADDIFTRLDEDPEESLDDYLDCFIDNAQQYGFALAEKRFQKRPNGTLTFRSLKTRHPDSWLIHTDRHGNVERYEQRGSKTNIDIDPKAILAYTPTKSTVGPYGRSDLRRVYSSWFVKRHISRFYSIYLEKAASALPVAKYDKNLPDAKVTQLHNIIKKFQTKTALTIPKEIELDFLEAKSNGEAFIKGLNIFNMFIGRGLFVPDLLGFSGGETSTGGSQALGREQVDMFLKHIARRRRSIERLVNRHIIQPMVIFNNGFVQNYPKFQLRPITEEDTKEYARIFIDAVKGKFYKPSEEEVNHLRSLLKFPEGEVELTGTPAGAMPPGVDPRLVPTLENTPADVPKPDDQTKNELEKIDELGKKKKMDFEFEFKPFQPTEGDFADKVNFQAIESQLMSSESALVSELRPVIEEIFEDLFDQISKKNILGPNPKPERIESIKLKKLKTFQQILKKHFRQSFKSQGVIARAELFKQNFTTPIDSEKFLELLEQETFQYVGDWEFNVTKEARIELQNAIREGRPISSVIDILDDGGKSNAITSLERFSRTKFTEIANRARLAEFENSRVVDAYQYSAILDGRTSQICAGLHGKIFKKGTEPIPPLHFNCRSILVPITIFEPHEISEEAGGKIETRDPKDRRRTVTRTIPKQPIDKFIDENIGKGFSRR